MRCPSCNKFPAFEIQEPDLDLNEVDHGRLTGNVRLYLNTECCGEEVKENNFEIDLDLTDNIIDALREAGVNEPDLDRDDIEYEVTDESAEGDERYESTTKKGKPINPRFQKKFYTCTVTVTVKVTYPLPTSTEPTVVETEGVWTDEVQASSMEELC